MKEMVNYTLASGCRLCEGTYVNKILNLKDTPPGDLYRKSINESNFESVPSWIGYCSDCGHIQMCASVDPRLLYSSYLSRPAATNSVLSDLYKQYADEVARLAEGGKVLEIGSNDGLFLQALERLGVEAYGIEPAFNLHDHAVRQRGVRSINAFFSRDTLVEYDLAELSLIFANHSVSNIEDIRGLASGVAQSLKPDGVFIIQTFYQIDVFEKFLIENYNHEHLSYFSVKSISKLFTSFGLKLFKVRYIDAKGGSIRCYFRKSLKNCNLDPESNSIVQREIEHFNDIYVHANKTSNYISDRVQTLRKLLSGFEQNRVCAYGTSIGATVFLYQFELIDCISTLLDDDPIRQGLFSPGLGLPVRPGESLNRSNFDVCLITAPLYADSIMQKHSQFLANGGQFIKFYPYIEVIGR